MDSIATNDDLAVTGAELEEQNKDIQPSDMPKVGESINTVQTSEKTENIDVQGGDIGHDFLGKIQPRTQALSSTLLAGENTLAGAGHVTHAKLIAYQGDGKSLVSYYMFPLSHFTLRLQGVAA
jgi:hypothetical protein